MFSPSAIPLFTGRKIRNVVLTLITLNSNGNAFTRGTAVDLSATQTLEGVEFDEDLDVEEISAANAQVKNYVAKKTDWTAVVREIVAANGVPNTLVAWQNASYVLIEAMVSPTADADYAANGGPLQPNGATNSYVIQAPGIMTAHHVGFSEGKEIAELTVRPCGLFIGVTPLGNTLYYNF